MEDCEMTQADTDSHRLVHLDLKGAPPKIHFYEKLFPLLRGWGATGLLVEYEDMFPYSDHLASIAAPHAYSVEEIKQLLSLAADNQLTVIPLVQTFGHMEFVLKHDEWSRLREIAEFPTSICPLCPGSLDLVTDMLQQVLSLHPDVNTIHIGADEVYPLGACSLCTQHMEQQHMNPVELYAHHVRSVCARVQLTHPDLTYIVWDDIFREADLATLQRSGIGEVVEPMVWFYERNFNLPPDIWDRYKGVFHSVWVASAFKGATGPCRIVTDIGYHVENHQGWLALLPAIKQRFPDYRGIALTGWQRYDHYSVLCELLPVALPSLTLCLLTISTGSFTEAIHKQASTELGFKNLLPLQPFPEEVSQCDFPGSGIFQAAHHLLSLHRGFDVFMSSHKVRAWMTPYHVKHKYSNPALVHQTLTEAQNLLLAFENFRTYVEVSLSEVFYPDAVDEFISVNLNYTMNQLETVVNDAKMLISHGAHVKDYKGAIVPDK